VIEHTERPDLFVAGCSRVLARVEALLVRAYDRVRRMRRAQRALLAVGPFFHVFGRKRGA
jgi:hypothetical protein